jgi:riboflavin kinase/FMN adenylyltransferase
MPKIYRGLNGLEAGSCRRALSVGNFDGVHLGHRRILRRVAEVAFRRGWRAAAVTFDPHPAKIVASNRAPRLLSTPEERCALMAEDGIQEVFILPFGPEIANLSPEEFVHGVLTERLHAAAVMVGANFHFGRGQAGDVARLAQLGKSCGMLTEVVQELVLRGQVVSSSRIRGLVDVGDVTLAARLLGRPYALEGEVVPGFGIGSSQTVPTLNLKTRAEVLPATGVYITRTKDPDTGREWPSVTNAGYRPTFGGGDLSIETHLLRPLEGPDPVRIRLEFLRRLRPETRFPDVDSLRTQILRDKHHAERFFRLTDRLVYSRRIPA